ncbi:hypothetical protein AB0L28_32535 [Streptomyces sp. NPDC052503]|uniref:hypothetical protein n=1 Tax=Streptomyces sp. NPDC052503 TaxID=3156683 RepID=UPI003447A7E2
MNRNRKHPERSPHRRAARQNDRTKNANGYRVTGTWEDRPDRPTVKPTQDRKARDRIAREMAADGAYVVVEEHAGYGQWRPLYEIDGPARLEAARRLMTEPPADGRQRARHITGAQQ